MKTRTHLKLLRNGVVCCTCGTLWDFAEDINDFILPLLDSTITASFNDRKITISIDDTSETIRKKFCKVSDL